MGICLHKYALCAGALWVREGMGGKASRPEGVFEKNCDLRVPVFGGKIHALAEMAVL